jgi:hypothetical protein
MLHKGIKLDTIEKVAGSFEILSEFAQEYFVKGGFNEDVRDLEDSEITSALELSK